MTMVRDTETSTLDRSSTPATLGVLLRHNLLTWDDECNLAKKALKGRGKVKQAAIDELVRCNAKLCFSISVQIAKDRSDIPDFFSVGLVGLRKAAARFNPALKTSNKARFCTYASFYIRQAMTQYIRECLSGASGLSSGAAQMLTKVRHFQKDYFAEHGRLATGAEIADGLGISYAKAVTLAGISTKASLDAPQGRYAEDGHSLYDEVVDEGSPCAATTVEREDITRMLYQTVEDLPKVERMILARRFGLGGRRPETLGRIARSYDITRERVRQIEAMALKTLRLRISRKSSPCSELAA